MITPKGKLIEINDNLEWILFNRIIKKTNPIKLLETTDTIIQLPNFLFICTFILMFFIDVELWIKLILPSTLYFIAQIIINFKLRLSGLILLPASVFKMANKTFMLVVFIASFFYFKWWICLIFLIIYFITIILSITIMTSSEKKYYKKNYNVNTGNFEIFKNNAFLCAYKYTAKKMNITTKLNPTNQEIENHLSERNHFTYMRQNWNKLKDHFNYKSQQLWTAYLFPNK